MEDLDRVVFKDKRLSVGVNITLGDFKTTQSSVFEYDLMSTIFKGRFQTGWLNQ